MLAKITLDIGGQETPFQKSVNARMTRTALEARGKYFKEFTATGMITTKMADDLVEWAVEAFDGKFTADQFLDGYGGSCHEIVTMMDGIILAVSDAMVEFPKRNPEAQK